MFLSPSAVGQTRRAEGDFAFAASLVSSNKKLPRAHTYVIFQGFINYIFCPFNMNSSLRMVVFLTSSSRLFGAELQEGPPTEQVDQVLPASLLCPGMWRPACTCRESATGQQPSLGNHALITSGPVYGTVSEHTRHLTCANTSSRGRGCMLEPAPG